MEVNMFKIMFALIPVIRFWNKMLVMSDVEKTNFLFIGTDLVSMYYVH